MRLTNALLIAAATTLTPLVASAQSVYSLTSVSAYTQNFNALGTSNSTVTDGVLNNLSTSLSGWSFLEGGSGTTGLTTITAGTGSSNAGDTYNFGSSAAADRALGGLGSGSKLYYLGFKFTNNTGATITTLDVAYIGEMWRLAAATDTLAFSYQLSDVALNAPTGWTSVTALNFATPSTGTAAATDGNAVGNRTSRSSSLTGLSIANGSTITFRWTDTTGTSSAGMAIDDFSLTATLQALTFGNYWAPGASGGGTGTWSSSSATWSATSGTQGTASQATSGALIFGSNGGTVTVSGTATANAGLTFSADAYTVTGGTVSLGGADAAANTVTVGSALTAIFNSTLSAANGLTKAGNGSLTLGGSNTLGAVSVSAGTLKLANASALGSTASGTSVASGATLDLNAQTVGAEAIALSGTLANSSASAASLAGLVTASGSAAISTTGNLTLSGGTAGSGSLTKSGNGTLTLTGSTGHTGGTTVSAGSLVTSGSGTLTGDVTLASGTTLTLAGATTLGTFSAGNSTLNLAFGNALTTTTLNLDGSLSLSLTGLGLSPAAGTYQVLNFTSLTGAGSINFTQELAGYSLVGTLNADNYSVAITLLAKALSWSGSAGTWSVSGGNWTNDSTSAAETFSSGDHVTFGSGGAGGTGGQITVGAGVTFGSLTFTSNTLNYSFTGEGLAGAGNVVLNGGGTVSFANANTFTGAIQVNFGTLEAANDSALGSTSAGTTIGTNGQLFLKGGVTISGEALSLGGTLRGSEDTNTYGGAITLTEDAAITSLGTLNVTGAISGAGHTLDVYGDGAVNLSGGLTAGALTKSGDSALTISAASTLGGTTLTSGTINLNHATALGNGTLTINGGALGNTSGAAKTLANAVTVGGDFDLGTDSSDGSLTLSGAVNLGGTSRAVRVVGSNTLSGAVTNGSLTKTGGGTLTLSGSNTFSALSVDGGTLRMGSSGALGGSAVAVATGATLELNGQNATLTSVSGSGTVSNGAATNSTLTLNVADATTLSTSLSDGVGGGKLGLTKTGNGALTVSSSNANSGAVAIQSGSVVATAAGALGSGAVTLSAGTTLAAGNVIALSNDITVRAAGTLETFNSLSSGLPSGWTVRTGATASSLGTTATLVTAATDWSSTSGNFRNVASFGSGLAATASIADQAAATDRALGVRQTGSFGDPGAAFVYQFSTAGQTPQGLSVDLQMLSVQARSTTWTIQIAAGASPTSWTTLGTFSDPGTFGSTTVSYDAAALASIADQSTAWFRVAAFGASTGSGSRDTLALDNFSINYGGANAVLGVTQVDDVAEFTGAVSLLGSANLTASSGATATFSGDISGAGAITKVGAGTVVLSGTNAFTGGLTISEGTLEAGSFGALGAGTVSLAGGTLDLGGYDVAGTISLDGGALAGTSGLTSAATLLVNSDATLTFGNLTAFGSANLTLSGGTIDLNDLNPTNVITYVSGTFLNAEAWSGTVAATGTGDVTSSIAALISAGLTPQLNAGQSANLNGISADVVLNGATVSGLSGFTGNLAVASGTVDLSSLPLLFGGTLEVRGGTISFGSEITDRAVTYSGGTITGSNYSGTVTIASGATVTLGASTIASGATIRTAADVSLNLDGATNALVYAGGTLSGLDTFTGALTVDGAKLVENGLINTSVALAAGGALGGDVEIAGSLTQESGSILAPGNSPGTALVNGDLLLGSGATLDLEVLNVGDLLNPASAGVDYDTTTTLGKLDLSSLDTFSRYIIQLTSIDADSANATAGGFLADQVFQLVVFTFGTIDLGGNASLSELFDIRTDTADFAFLGEDGVTAVDASRFSIQQVDNTLLLTYTPIPEPSTYGLILGGLALAGAALRRRKAKSAAAKASESAA